MEKIDFKERVGKLVVINGGYVLINHREEENDKDRASIIYVWAKDEETRQKEIGAKIDLIYSSNGSKTNVGNTKFLSSYIGRACNEKAFKDHVGPTGIIVVFNKETKEFFLIMDEYKSLKEAQSFVHRTQYEYWGLIEGLGFNGIEFPYKVESGSSFELVMDSFLVFIKLETL